MIKEITQEAFEQEVLKEQGLVLLDFWGPQCTICKALEPKIEKLDEDHPELKVVKMNIVGNRKFCMSLRVMSLPTFIFYKNGQLLKTFVMPEAANISALEKFVEENISQKNRGAAS